MSNAKAPVFTKNHALLNIFGKTAGNWVSALSPEGTLGYFYPWWGLPAFILGVRQHLRHALHIGGGLAMACLDRVSPVGVLGTGDRELRIEPTLQKDRVMQWMLALRRHAFDERTRLVRRIQELRPTLQSRSLIIAISDLHEPECTHALALLAQACSDEEAKPQLNYTLPDVPDVEEAEPETFFNNPGNERTRQFLAQVIGH